MRKLTGFSITVLLAWLATTILTESKAAQPLPVTGPTAAQQSRQCPPKGPCVPAITTWGYYEQPAWREWPGEKRLEKKFPAAIGREQLPPPPPTEALPPFSPNTQQLPMERGLVPGEGPSREVLPPGNVIPPDGTSLPSGILPPGGILPPSESDLPKEPKEPAPGIETPAETESIPGLPREGIPGLPSDSENPTPAPPKSDSEPKKSIPDAPVPSGLPLDPSSGIYPPQPQQSQMSPVAPVPPTGRIPWRNVPEEPASSGAAERPQMPELGILGQIPAAVSGVPNHLAAQGSNASRYAAAGMAWASSTPGYTVAQSAQPVAGNLPIDMPQDAATHSSVYEQPAGSLSGKVDRAWQSEQAPVAIEGFCPVDLGKNERWTKGDARWAVVHEGRTYLMSGPVQRECFLVDPQRYIPAQGGFDPVLLQEGRQAIGLVDYCVTYDGKLYMFSSAASLAKFRQDARKYMAH